MDQTNQRLPATTSAGMALKVRDAFRQPIDGHPASQGLPMEAELKHYYNYLLKMNSTSILSSSFSQRTCAAPFQRFIST